MDFFKRKKYFAQEFGLLQQTFTISTKKCHFSWLKIQTSVIFSCKFSKKNRCAAQIEIFQPNIADFSKKSGCAAVYRRDNRYIFHFSRPAINRFQTILSPMTNISKTLIADDRLSKISGDYPIIDYRHFRFNALTVSALTSEWVSAMPVTLVVTITFDW